MFVVRWFLGLGTRIKSILITALILILIFGTILVKVHFSKKAVPKVSYSNVYSERIEGRYWVQRTMGLPRLEMSGF